MGSTESTEQPKTIYESIMDLPDIPRNIIIQTALNKSYFDSVDKKYKGYLAFVKSSNKRITEDTYLNTESLPKNLVYDPSINYRKVVNFLIEETERSSKAFQDQWLPRAPFIFRYLNLADKAAWAKFWLNAQTLDDILKTGELMFSGSDGENLKVRMRPKLERVDPESVDPATFQGGREVWYRTEQDVHYNEFLDSWFTWVPKRLIRTNLSAGKIRLFEYEDGRIHLITILNRLFIGTVRDLYNLLVPIIEDNNPLEPDMFMISKDTDNVLEVVVNSIL
jgi:hypothetical protein